jgi:hypothetical protein
LIAGIIGFGVDPAVSQPVKSNSGSVELTVAQASSRLVAARERLKTQTAWFQKNGGGSGDRISAKSLELKNNFLAGLQGDVSKAERAYSDVLKATGTTASVSTSTVKMTLKQARKAESKTRYLARMVRYKADRTARKALTSSKRVKGFTRWIAKKNVSPEKQKELANELANRQVIAKKTEADAALAAKAYNEAKAAAAGARANLDALNTYQASNSTPSATNPTPPAAKPMAPVVNVSSGTVPGYESYEGYGKHKIYYYMGRSGGEYSMIRPDQAPTQGAADYSGDVTLRDHADQKIIGGKLDMNVDFASKKITGGLGNFRSAAHVGKMSGQAIIDANSKAISGRVNFNNVKVGVNTRTFSYADGHKDVQKRLSLGGGLKGDIGQKKVSGNLSGLFHGGTRVMEASGTVEVSSKQGRIDGIFSAKRKN